MKVSFHHRFSPKQAKQIISNMAIIALKNDKNDLFGGRKIEKYCNLFKNATTWGKMCCF